MNEFAANVVKDAGIELKARQKKTTYRARWKNGVPYAIKKRVKSYIPRTSGELERSLEYRVIEISGNKVVVFYAEEYWYYVNFGRKAGKYAPVSVIRKWIRDKGIKPQKLGGGGFAKVTSKTYDTMAFLMNRKIKHFGIEGNRFWSKTFEIYEGELQDGLPKQIAKDILNTITKWQFS